MRNKKYWIIIIIGLYAFFELACFVSLILLKNIHHISYDPIRKHSLRNKHKQQLIQLMKDQSVYVTHDSELGWTLKPNSKHDIYQANSQGIRSSREYTFDPPANKIRIATFGDSFTHCDNVENHNMWQEQLQKISSSLEVINFGVGGYGLDQALLRYRYQGTQYKPHMVFIGFMSENIFRNVSTFRPFYHSNTNLPLTKPYFIFNSQNKLEHISNPFPNVLDYMELLAFPDRVLPELGKFDYHYQTRYGIGHFDFLPSVKLVKIAQHQWKDSIIKSGYYNTQSEAFIITKKLLDKFYKKTIKNNAKPIIILHVSKEDLIRYRENKTKVYQPLLDYLESQKYDYIDLMDAFEKYGQEYSPRKLFISHYSEDANRMIAKHIYSYLSSHLDELT